MPTNETIRRLRNKDNTGPQLGEWEAKFGDASKFNPNAPSITGNEPGAEPGTFKSPKTKSKGKGSSGKTKDAVKGVIDGASKVLSTLQAANAKSQRGLGNLNKTGYDNIRDPGTVKGQSALANDADDKEYQQAKAKIEKEDKKNGYA